MAQLDLLKCILCISWNQNTWLLSSCGTLGFEKPKYFHRQTVPNWQVKKPLVHQAVSSCILNVWQSTWPGFKRSVSDRVQPSRRTVAFRSTRLLPNNWCAFDVLCLSLCIRDGVWEINHVVSFAWSFRFILEFGNIFPVHDSHFQSLCKVEDFIIGCVTIAPCLKISLPATQCYIL